MRFIINHSGKKTSQLKLINGILQVLRILRPETPLTSLMLDSFILGIFFSAIYFFGLDTYPLFIPDEGRYTEVAREMLATHNFITPHVNGVVFLDKPILFYWLQVLSLKLFGINEWATRFMPTMAAMFTCFMTYLAARTLYDRLTGILASCILASSLLFFISSHYANLDLEIAFWISTSLFAFIIATFISQARLKKFCFLLMFIASGLAFLTKGLIGIAFPFGIAFSWILLQKRWDVFKSLPIIIGTTIWLAVVLPWFIAVQKANPMFFNYYFITQQITRFLSADIFNNQQPWWFYFPALAVGFFPWTIFLIQSCKQIFINPTKHAADSFFALWILLIFIFFSIPHSKIITYILPIFPAVAIVIARYLQSALTQISKSEIYFAIFNFIIMCSLVAISSGFIAYRLNELLKPYVFTIAVIFICAGTASLFALRKKNLLALIIICLFSSTGFLLCFVSAASHLNQNSTKSLVATLKSQIKPQDEVVSYFKYYYDLPFYLHRQITLVYDWRFENIIQKDNWARELGYGKKWYQPKHLIDEKNFWRLWNSNKRLYVFLNENYFAQFKEHTSHYHTVAQDKDVFVLTNQN